MNELGKSLDEGIWNDDPVRVGYGILGGHRSCFPDCRIDECRVLGHEAQKSGLMPIKQAARYKNNVWRSGRGDHPAKRHGILCRANLKKEQRAREIFPCPFGSRILRFVKA